MTRRTSILLAYFVFGAYAVCAQATLLRETQVLLFGSELSWGLVLAFWLAGVAMGATLGGRREQRATPHQTLLGFAYVCLAMPLVLFSEVVVLRTVRSFLGVGPGEYVGPAQMLWITLISTVPVSLCVGLTFPAASALLARDEGGLAGKARAIGWVYLAEAAGSLAGGVLFSYLLVDRVGALPLALGGGALLAASAACLVHAHGGRRWAVVIPLVFALAQVLAIASGKAGNVDRASVGRRWSSFAPGLRLVDTRDTRYQNVAIGRLGDQYSLYANGLVAATWPNHADLAVEAHLAACEHPAPRRILVLGGGAEGMLKELLRHRPERLDYVTLDPDLLALMRGCLADEDRRALDFLGEGVHFEDARRFVKRAAARGERYDLVLLAAPQPASTLEARLYTEEFFGELADAMADDGAVAFTLSGALGYWSPEPAAYVGSIVLAAERVFPDVLLTFGYPTHCFAAKREGVLAKTGDALAERYRRRGVTSPHFDPLWFAGASDLLDPEKRASVTRALETHPPAFLNTDERPAAALYHMRFWLQTSEAAHAGPSAPARQRFDVLGMLMGLRFEQVMPAAVGATALAALVGLVRGRAALRRTALLWSVGTTGFASMALEIVLLYTFQTLYGYVYSMIGAVVGVFMFGLVVGSWAMNRRLARAPDGPARGLPGLKTVAGLDLATAVFAAAMVLVLALLRRAAADWTVQAATFALVGLAGVLGGLVFPLAAAVTLERDPNAGRAAGAVAAADYVGACLGALATGVLLVPILGVSGACLAVAAVKVLSGLLVGAAATMRPAISAPASPAAAPGGPSA